MSARQDEPFEIQPRANGVMARVLESAAVVALVLGAVGVLLPGTPGVAVAWAAVGVVVGVPLLRVAWLALRWIRRRDLRFAGLASGLLLIVALSAAAAALQGR